MKDLLKIVASLAKLIGYLAVAVAAGVAWCGLAVVNTLARVAGVGKQPTRQPAGSMPAALEPESVPRKQLPKPPSMDEYRAAGVDPNSCSLCRKRTPERAREWRYMVFDARPAVVCPTCWRKNVTNNTDAGAAAFEARIGSKVWNSPRVDDTYRGLRGE